MAISEPYVRAIPSKGLARFNFITKNTHASKKDWIAISLLGVVTVVALIPSVIAPYNPLNSVGAPFLPPGSNGFLLGTDSAGRDILSRILFGIQSSWFSALGVIASGVIIGGIVGVIAGAVGGFIDTLLMRITDLFLALPGPVLAIAVVAAIGPSLFHVLIAVAIVWWPFYARIVRGEIRALASRPHLEAAKVSGVGAFRRMWRHLLPGALPAIVVTASLDIGNLIITLASLSFLGLGAPAPAPELGAMTARNLGYFLQDWWIPVLPGIGLLILALVGNLAGDGLRNLMGDR